MRKHVLLALIFLFSVGFIGVVGTQAFAQDNNTWNLNDLINFVAQDINRMWATEFAENEIQYRPPNFIDGYYVRTRTACGRVQIRTALYCGTSHSIHFEINFMNNALRQIGDFAVAAVIAHEWAHAVQAQLGLLNTDSVERELQADCLAGAYAQYARDESGALEEGDFEEGRRLFSLLGDPEGLDANDEHAHGTAAQRVDAYETGFEEGIGACFNL